MSSDHKFQVNLRGIIDLLSHHLYSGPDVYLRELLQNGVDAISARMHVEPDHRGTIRLEVVSTPGSPPTMIVTDNGIGLSESEVHQFLATIGESSKRDSISREDFIGQFGIGMLSGFVVSDEIVIITKSIRPESPTVEWSGRADGTYTVRTLDREFDPGTQIFLRAKPGFHDFFEPEFVRERVQHFGGHLPYPIHLSAGREQGSLNTVPPWMFDKSDRRAWREACLEYGREVFGAEFFDAIPLQSEWGEVEGVAYVLPHSTTVARKQPHRVYLKNMLLSEQAENLLPDWAFFVRCVVNATGLRPTAARESFYEDETLAAARSSLGDCLRNYLLDLARHDRDRLNQLIGVHYLPIKALAVEDDEFYRLFIQWLPFETSLGQLTLEEYLRSEPNIRYVTTRDQFRQIAGVAAAQSQCIVNAGYVYDQELIEKLPEIFPDYQIEEVDISELSHTFEDLALDEREQVFEFVRLADLILQPFKCAAEIKKFEPTDLPTLYTTNEAASFLRSIEQSKDISNELWSGVLDRIAETPAAGAAAQLCFNFSNPLIQQLVQLTDRTLIQRTVEMLYVQALLLGHFPLKAQETRLLSDGLLGLIEYVVKAPPKDQP